MLLVNAIDRLSLEMLLDRYGLALQLVAPEEIIPGSYWGEREAGLIGAKIFARLDTPLHSVLHESAHFICMTPERRAGLDTDAGGDDAEESAVCYLQLILADLLPNVSRERMCRDMDEWGYSFRLGSTAAWFAGDAEDARDWLIRHGLLDPQGPGHLCLPMNHGTCRGAPRWQDWLAAGGGLRTGCIHGGQCARRVRCLSAPSRYRLRP